MLQGRFITVEGGEGVGKSTQCNQILELLKSLEIETLTETLLLFAARRDHVTRTIISALEAGVWVISDRFFDSTLAYQGYGHGIDLSFLKMLNDRVNGSLAPDLTFILDAPSQIGVSRALERFVIEFHDRARQGFMEIAQTQPHRCRVIDATQPLNVVRNQISTILIDHFQFKI